MLYPFSKGLMRTYFSIFYRFKVSGIDNLPEEGGYILCSNHKSNADPILLGISVNKKVHYMAKEELFKNPIANKILRALGAYPVNRNSASMSSMRSSVDLLKDGKVVGIFAQGSRMSEIDVKSAKAGVSLFALKSGVPVVPVSIRGELKAFSKIEVNIGKPLQLEKYREQKLKTELLEQATEEIMEAIKEGLTTL